MAAKIPLSQAVGEYLTRLELDRHAAEGTVAEYRDLERFAGFAGGDAGVPTMSWLDRDLLRLPAQVGPGPDRPRGSRRRWRRRPGAPARGAAELRASPPARSGSR
jgi:hypothetical protein